jgi:hypothetical protein
MAGTKLQCLVGSYQGTLYQPKSVVCAACIIAVKLLVTSMAHAHKLNADVCKEQELCTCGLYHCCCWDAVWHRCLCCGAALTARLATTETVGEYQFT